MTIMLDCGDSEFRDMTLPFRGNPQARIARDGSFALAGRRGGRSYRLAGRFLGPQYGRLRYSARMRSSRLRKVCRSGENGDPLALYRNGIPPYGGCRSQRALTLLWSETGRVFQQYRLVGGLHGSGWRPHAYACLFATPHRRVDLGQNYDEATVELPRIAGTLVAHVAATTDIGGGYARLRVLDLSGAPTRVIDATPGGPRDSTSRVWDLVLKPNGSIAWTVFDSGSWPFEPQQVWALDAAGLRQLDSGPGLDLDSLELSESTLTWINGARTRSATLD